MKLTEAQILAMAKRMYQSGEKNPEFYNFDRAMPWIKEYWVQKARYAAKSLEEE